MILIIYVLFGFSILTPLSIAASVHYPNSRINDGEVAGKPVVKGQEDSIHIGHPKNYLGSFGDSQYYWYPKEVDQAGSMAHCKLDNFDLLSIGSEAELNYIFSVFSAKVWTDGRDRGNAAQMFWAGSGGSITVPLGVNPTIYNGVQLYLNGTSQLNVRPITETLSYVICEQKL